MDTPDNVTKFLLLHANFHNNQGWSIYYTYKQWYLTEMLFTFFRYYLYARTFVGRWLHLNRLSAAAKSEKSPHSKVTLHRYSGNSKYIDIHV